MTRDQFITGQAFRVGAKKYQGEATFTYADGCILKQSRSSTDDVVLFTNHHCNVTTVGKNSFKGFVYVMDKLVRVSYKFEVLEIV